MTSSKEYVVVGSGHWGAEPGNVTTYSLDRAAGTLTQIDRKPAGGLASFLARHPSKPLIYVADEGGGDIYWMQVNPSTGSLTPGGSQSTAGHPVYLSVDGSGSVLISANYGEGTTILFPLDGATGAVQGAANQYDTGGMTHAAVIRPGTSHVFVTSLDENRIAQFDLEGTTLSPLTPADVSQDTPRHLAFHPNGSYAYAVSENSNLVGAYTVTAGGTLDPLGDVNRLPQADEGAPNHGADIHVSPSGKHVYASNRGTSNTLAIYSVGSDGSLTLTGHESTRGAIPRNFTIDPDGELLLAANQDSQNIAIFRIAPADGSLTHLNTIDIEVSPFFVAVWRFEE